MICTRCSSTTDLVFYKEPDIFDYIAVKCLWCPISWYQYALSNLYGACLDVWSYCHLEEPRLFICNPLLRILVYFLHIFEGSDWLLTRKGCPIWQPQVNTFASHHVPTNYPLFLFRNNVLPSFRRTTFTSTYILRQHSDTIAILSDE